jgi:transcriptional regulator with XRE-family HTH domain
MADTVIQDSWNYKRLVLDSHKKKEYQITWDICIPPGVIRDGTNFQTGISKLSTTPSGGKYSPIAQRLRQLRAAEGYGERGRVKEYAAKIGINATTYYNYENGFPITVDVILKICQAVDGMSADWLLSGRKDALPLALIRRLETAQPENGAPGQTASTGSAK